MDSENDPPEVIEIDTSVPRVPGPGLARRVLNARVPQIVFGVLTGLFVGLIPGPFLIIWIASSLEIFITGKPLDLGRSGSPSDNQIVAMVVAWIATIVFCALIGLGCGIKGPVYLTRTVLRIVFPRRYSLRGILLLTAAIAVLLSVTVTPVMRQRRLYEKRRFAEQAQAAKNGVKP